MELVFQKGPLRQSRPSINLAIPQEEGDIFTASDDPDRVNELWVAPSFVVRKDPVKQRGRTRCHELELPSSTRARGSFAKVITGIVDPEDQAREISLKMKVPERQNPGALLRTPKIRKVWVSIKFFSAKFGFTPPPPKKKKGPKMRKHCTSQQKIPKIDTFSGGGGGRKFMEKRFGGHLGVSEKETITTPFLAWHFWTHVLRGLRWLQVAWGGLKVA